MGKHGTLHTWGDTKTWAVTAEEAEVLRDVLGVRKRMELDPEDLERRRALMTRARDARKLPSDRPSDRPIG